MHVRVIALSNPVTKYSHAVTYIIAVTVAMQLLSGLNETDNNADIQLQEMLEQSAAPTSIPNSLWTQML